jgi:hypothetical protein
VRSLVALVALTGVARADDVWVALDRVSATLAEFHDAARPYDTPLDPRPIAGAIDIACERQEGRPCGDGTTAFSEADASAGYGQLAWVATRLRLQHTPTGSDFVVDRLHANAQLGPVALEVGRDVLAIGPASRTQFGWSTNAPPLDHVRVEASRVLATDVRGSLMYVVGTLRAPQTYPGNLVTIARGQLDVGSFQLGLTQLLQLGGDGAPGFTWWQFIEEHITRRQSFGPADSSNRRILFDFAGRIGGLHDARFYYQIAFEDWRQQFASAVRYDADHMLGIDDTRDGVLIEVMKTGVRSEEHELRTTGFTNAGRAVGAALGPDAQSIFVSKRLGVVSPWIELAQLSSDTYNFPDNGAIMHTADGPPERRYRAGVDATLPVRRDLRVDIDLVYERVTAFAFDPTARRNNLGATITVAWSPQLRWQR